MNKTQSFVDSISKNSNPPKSVFKNYNQPQKWLYLWIFIYIK